jgi:23S rRNA pseudouridine1911/1915/1917 synthase
MTSSLSLTALAGRLDKVAAEGLSRARLQALIKEGHVKVGGKVVKDGAHKLKGGEEITLTLPAVKSVKTKAQDIPLDVVFEDKYLLVINKPAGLVVHPAAGHAEDTLVNALLHHCGDSLSGIGGEARPGIVHRLDKDTSGLMVVAKTDAAHNGLAIQFGQGAQALDAEEDEEETELAPPAKTLHRAYQAFVWGLPKPTQGTIDVAIGRSTANRKKMMAISAQSGLRRIAEDGTDDTERKHRHGKEAITHYEVQESYGLLVARVNCVLDTGRTHQIRVHLASIGHGVLGDAMYGRAKGHHNHSSLKKLSDVDRDIILKFPRQALHAAELSFIHPVTGKTVRYKAPLPDDLKQLAKALKKI